MCCSKMMISRCEPIQKATKHKCAEFDKNWHLTDTQQHNLLGQDGLQEAAPLSPAKLLPTRPSGRSWAVQAAYSPAFFMAEQRSFLQSHQ